jgi:PIN domain nuclease of toxin-antitoxin system
MNKINISPGFKRYFANTSWLIGHRKPAWLDDSPYTFRKAKAAIADGKNLVFISAVVIWGIRIKQALGKLELTGVKPEELPDFAAPMNLETL